MFLAGILLRHPDGIQVKNVIILPCEPEDYFIPAGESPGGMQPVSEMPYDTVSEVKIQLLKNREQYNIQGNNLPIVDIVSDLPTDATGWFQYANAFLNDLSLL
jgi:hypothetical protein